MFRLLLQWVLSAVSLMGIAKLLPGVYVKSFGTAMVVAAVYGVLSVLCSWLLGIIFFLPLLLTFGLFALVINALLLFVTDQLVEDFAIDSLITTLIAAVALTILNGIWRWLLF
jgi:putative membrane protein